jgi:ribosomal protein S13
MKSESDQIFKQLRVKLHIQVGKLLDEKICNQVYNQVSNQINNNVYKQFYVEIHRLIKQNRLIWE